MKSYQIDRIPITGLPIKSLSLKDTKQRPIFPKKKYEIKVSNKWCNPGNNNNGNDNNDVYDTTSTFIVWFNTNLYQKKLIK